MASGAGAGFGWRDSVALVRLFAVGAAGAGVFALLGLPAPYLSGPLVAVSIVTILGWHSRVPAGLANVIFLVVGISLGTGVTPDALAEIGRWPGSMAFLLVYLVATQLGVQAYFRVVAGWDRATAFFAAIPGALSYVLVLGPESRADMRKVTIAQVTRVFILVAVTPSVLVALQAAAPRPFTRLVGTPLEIAVMAVVGIAGGWLFHRMRLPAPWLIGGLAASAALHASGLVVTALPPEIFVPGIVALGSIAGNRFQGADMALLRSSGVAAVGAFVVAIAITAAFAVLTSVVVGLPIGQTLLAFAPGGIDAMAMMAFVLSLDTAYVAVHHLVRVLAIAIMAPIWGRSMLERREPEA